MKEWSKHWKTSKSPKKQRKYLHNLPAHLKGKTLSSHLSKDLRQKYGIRNIRARKGDKVKIARGQNKGKIGTIESVDVKNTKLYITGIELTKRDGNKAKQPIHPSNVIIQELDTSDKRRLPTNTTQKQTKSKPEIQKKETTQKIQMKQTEGSAKK